MTNKCLKCCQKFSFFNSLIVLIFNLLKFSIILFISISLNVNAKDVIQDTEYCSINWSTGYIYCKGESASGQNKLNAKRAAVVIAQRNLLELVKGIRIDSEKTIIDGIIHNDIITSKVSGVVRGAKVISNKYNKIEQSSIATLQIHMGKNIRTILNESNSNISINFNKKIEKLFSLFNFGISNAYAKETYILQDKETINKLINDFKESNDNISLIYLESIINDVKNQIYTGLLIDAREIHDLKPALTIKLVDNNGIEIYPGKYVDNSIFVGRNGLSVGMDFDINDAINNKRVFKYPLKIKGESTYKQRKSDIVISNDNLKKIKVVIGALKEAKVIIVVSE